MMWACCGTGRWTPGSRGSGVLDAGNVPAVLTYGHNRQLGAVYRPVQGHQDPVSDLCSGYRAPAVGVSCANQPEGARGFPMRGAYWS